MEDREYIEMIASGDKTKGDIEKRLESYTNEARKDFCMKLYGRIPMGNISISESLDKDGHEVTTSKSIQQAREEENLIKAIGHIEYVFGFDTWDETNNVPDSPETTPETTQRGQMPTLEELLPEVIRKAENGLKIFEWAVGESWFTITSDGMKWSKEKALYGLFVREVETTLNLLRGNGNIDWTLFRFISNHEDCLQRAREKASKVKMGWESETDGYEKLKVFLRNIK